jgi:hypothetical protein
VFLATLAVTAQAQQTGVAAPFIPAAVQFQTECTGFIASPDVSHDLFVVGGADDDFHSVVRQFVQDDSIFISRHNAGAVSVGAEYRVVRPANELFRTMRYQGERWDVRNLGKPYEDVAQVQVTHVNPEGAVAKVTLSCGPIVPGDTLIPFQPRATPGYKLTGPLDHFTPLDNGKQHGKITASENNFGFLGRDTVVYLNLGEKDGAQPGQRFRIYKHLPPQPIGFLHTQRTPPETIGEVVVLSVQAKSCVAMVVSSYREISAGDYVEKE